MQKTKIPWTDMVYNPIKGCLGGCTYCYARKIAKRFPANFPKDFKPSFYADELYRPYTLKKRHQLIFTCSVSDFFGEGVKREWQNEVLRVIEDNKDLIFQVLTKQPQRIPIDIQYPDNMWMGVTITSQADVWKATPLTSAAMMSVHRGCKFVSVEPMFTRISFKNDTLEKLDWIIIGQQTNPNKSPEKEWVDDLVNSVKVHKIPVFMKDNIKHMIPDNEFIQEFPVVQWEK
jgi:protein gp37